MHFQEKTKPNIFRIKFFRKKPVRFGSVYDTEASEFGYLVFTTHRSTNWTGLHFQSHGLSIIESLNFFPIMHLFLILLLGILYMTLIARISIKENILIFKNTLQGLEMTGRNTQGLVCNLL